MLLSKSKSMLAPFSTFLLFFQLLEGPPPIAAQTAQDGTSIGDIQIVVEDIFDTDDPRENRRLYRLANRLHRRTRPQVIARQLLFESGDAYSQRVIDESERLLRTNRYLIAARILPASVEQGATDLEVRVRDVWTLNVGAGVGRGGGVTTTHFKLQDTNLLGLGKLVTLERRSSVDRTTSVFRFADPALLGSRWNAAVGYSSNSDGSQRLFEVGRPFYALETRWSTGFSGLSDDRLESRYALGEVSQRFRHREDSFDLQGGLSSGIQQGWVHRWSAGLTYQSDRFATEPGVVGPGRLPPDRELSYPWVAFDRIQDEYLKGRNLDQIDRTEDLHLGGKLHARLGYSTTALGASANRLVFEAQASRGFRFADRQMLLLASDLGGRWGGGETENASWSTSARYYARNFGDQLFSASFEGTFTHNLDPEHQLTLGGDNGLRGYPLRYQDGSARALLTLEQRFFTHWYPFRLAHVGGAIFVDIGKTWADGDAGGLSPNYGVLRDVGIGLRLASSRSGLGQTLHVDLAFPLDGDPSLQSVQWLVSSKHSF